MALLVVNERAAATPTISFFIAEVSCGFGTQHARAAFAGTHWVVVKRSTKRFAQDWAGASATWVREMQCNCKLSNIISPVFK